MHAPYALRPARDADADDVLAAFASAPDMERQGAVHDASSARTYLAWALSPERRATAVVTASDRMIGLVGISVDAGNALGWFFYWMHAEHRGKGLAARAAATVADRALAPAADGGWDLERLELGHRVDNPASGAVARAAGFVHEGTERAKFLIGGTRVDVLTYGRLRSDPVPRLTPLAWL